MSISPTVPERYELPVGGSLWLARWTSLIAAVTAFASALLGLRYGQAWLYQSEDLTLTQIYGQDIVVLLVVLPVLGFGLRSAARGSVRGLFAWGGTLMYLAYWYHFLLGGIEFGAIYLLHLALVGSSLVSLAVLGARLDVERIAHRVRDTLPARRVAGLMVVVASVFAAAGIYDIINSLRHREIIERAARGAYTVDLTVMLPATIVAGVLLWRRHSWGYALAGPLLVNATLSAATVLAALLVMLASGMSMAILGLPTAVMGVATTVLVVATLGFLRGFAAD